MATATTTPKTRVLEIPLADLAPSPTNPRKDFPEDQLKELANSLRDQGLQQPIVARENVGALADQPYEIVCGERRWRAAKIAGMETITTIVREMTDLQVMEVQVIENLQRADVHPLDEALGYHALLEQPGVDGLMKSHTVESLAAKVGKSASYVYQRLKLAALGEKQQKAFRAGEITAGHAVLIARLDPENQDKALAACFVTSWNSSAPGLLPEKDLRKWIQDNVHLDLSKAPFDTKDPELVPDAGACGPCEHRTGANPGLFSDVQKKDTCTKPACFQAKKAAFIQIEIAKAAGKAKIDTAKAKPVVTMQNTYQQPEAIGEMKVLRDYQAKVVKAGSCKYATVAYNEDSKKTTIVCVNKNCSKHHPKPRATGKSIEDHKKEQLKEDQEQAGRLALMISIGERCTKLPTNRVLALAAAELVDGSYCPDMDQDTEKVLIDEMGWKLGKAAIVRDGEESDEVPVGFIEEQIRKTAGKMSVNEGQRLIGLLIAGGMTGTWDSANLERLAKQVGKIDVAKVKRDAAKATAAEQKKQAKEDAKAIAAKCDEDPAPAKPKAKAKAAKGGR